MAKLFLAALTLALTWSSVNAAEPTTGTFAIVQKIRGPDGQWDYAFVDAAARRLYIARSYGVMIIDLQTGQLSPLSVPGDEVHGVAQVDNSTVLASTNGATGMVTLFDGRTGASIANIKAGTDPDAIVFEPSTHMLVVANHSGGDLTVIDPLKRAAAVTIAVGGTLEFEATDGAGLVYVNVTEKNAVAAVDVAKRKLLRLISLPDCEEPTGLAYDRAARRLMAVCVNGRAVVIDVAAGRAVASVETGKVPDAAIWDSERRLLFVPSYLAGTLTVVSLPLHAAARVVQVLATQVGTRTGALDPRTGRIYLPTSKLIPPKKAGDYPTPVAGTFEVLVVARH